MSIAIALLLATLLASATFAASASFKGSLQAIETYEVNPPTLSVDASGWGNFTHLGRVIVRYEVEVNLPTGSGLASAQFVAVNGDSISAEGNGQATPTETPDVVTIVEAYIITSGTGRFAGATGSFTVKRVLSQETGVTSGTIHGNMVIP